MTPRDLENMALALKTPKGKAGEAIVAARTRGWRFSERLARHIALSHTEKPGRIFIGTVGAFRYSKAGTISTATDAQHVLAKWLKVETQ